MHKYKEKLRYGCYKKDGKDWWKKGKIRLRI